MHLLSTHLVDSHFNNESDQGDWKRVWFEISVTLNEVAKEMQRVKMLVETILKVDEITIFMLHAASIQG